MSQSAKREPEKDRWIKIGLVGRPHGVRGDFFVAGRESELDTHFTRIRIGSDAGWGDEAKVTMIRNVPSSKGNKTVMRCSRSTNRDQAEELTGRPIWVARREINVDPETQYVWGDLIGRAVVDSDGFRVGHVLRVYNAGASDILVIRDEKARGLEIPVAPTYVDADSLGVDTTGGDGSIRLIVSSSLFADLWQESIDL